MRQMRDVFCAAALVGVTACASTPDPAPEAPPEPDVADIEAVTTPKAPPLDRPIWQPVDAGLQHIESGMVCPPAIAGFLFTEPQTYPGLPKGKDVSCSFGAAEGGAITIHLTDFGRAVSPEAHLKGAQTKIEEIFRVTEAAPPPRRPDGSALALSAASYRIDAVSPVRPGVPVDTTVWIERIGPWHLKARATYEIDRTEAIVAATDALFRSIKSDLAAPTLF